VNTITLTLGDPSGDGHERTESVVIKSTHTYEQINAAYDAAVRLVGVDIMENVANEYEEPYMSKDIEAKLLAYEPVFFDGLKLSRVGYYTERAYDIEQRAMVERAGQHVGCLTLDVDSFVQIFLKMVRIGNPQIVVAVVNQNVIPNIDIGGYGLF
jgi:hypothetical protein